MKILALDLGKYKTVGCDYERESGRHQFRAAATTPAALYKLVQAVGPDRVVIEVCSIAGWVCDLVRRMGIEIQVANTSDDTWRWRKVKKKNDRGAAMARADRVSAADGLAAHQDQESHPRPAIARGTNTSPRAEVLDAAGSSDAGGHDAPLCRGRAERVVAGGVRPGAGAAARGATKSSGLGREVKCNWCG